MTTFGNSFVGISNSYKNDTVKLFCYGGCYRFDFSFGELDFMPD